MQILRFKTNIKCTGCIQTVSPELNNLPGVETWSVDLETPDRMLTVQGDDSVQVDRVIEVLDGVGYRAEVFEA